MEDLNQNLSLNDSSKSFLKEIAGWAYFLSIVGFVMMALMVVMGIFMGTLMNALTGIQDNDMSMPVNFGASFGIIYFIMAVIYFFPIYYLYKFSTKVKEALRVNDENVLTESLNFLKKHYKFMGILMIVVLAFYGIILVAMLIGVGIGAMA